MHELIISPNQTMTSLDIAEVSEKKHKHVLQDIRNLIEQEAITEPSFRLSEYKDTSGKMNPMYNLDFEATIVLVTGYDAKRRAAIIKRWMQLETGEAEPALTGGQQFKIPDNMLLVSKDQVIEWKDTEILYLKSLLPKKRTPSRPLTEEVVAEIHRLKDLGLNQSDIAKRVNRSSASVSFVVRGAGPAEETN